MSWLSCFEVRKVQVCAVCGLSWTAIKNVFADLINTRSTIDVPQQALSINICINGANEFCSVCWGRSRGCGLGCPPPLPVVSWQQCKCAAYTPLFLLKVINIYHVLTLHLIHSSIRSPNMCCVYILNEYTSNVLYENTILNFFFY